LAWASCGWAGVCNATTEFLGEREFEKKTCDCDPGHFGDSCQFKGPCTEMIFQDDEFPGYGKSFHLLYSEDKKPLMVHDRPAYILKNPSSVDEFAALVFDGGRWRLVIEHDSFHEWDPTKGEKTIEKYLAEDFNALRDGEYDYEYISEYSNEGSPANVPFRASLSGQGSDSSVGKLGDEEFILLCADCEEDDDYASGISYCLGSNGMQNNSLCISENSPLLKRPVNRCNCEHGFIGPLCQTRPVEGKLLLHLEHGKKNSCSICGENNMWTVWELTGLNDKTCLPFPREPLVFEGANGTVVSRQLGLYLNETHFSVFVSNNGHFFPKDDDGDSNEVICSVQEGSNEFFSIQRNNVSNLMEQTHVDLAVLLNNNEDSLGEVVDPGDIDCFAKSGINEHECDGSKEDTLRKVYDPSLKKSDLMRAWIQFDLKVTQ